MTPQHDEHEGGGEVSNDEHAKSAAVAAADLFVFGAVVDLLEGGSSPRGGSSQDATRRIIAICKKQIGEALARYDRSLERIKP